MSHGDTSMVHIRLSITLSDNDDKLEVLDQKTPMCNVLELIGIDRLNKARHHQLSYYYHHLLRSSQRHPKFVPSGPGKYYYINVL